MVDDLVSKRDHLPNLELLPGPENIGKSDTAPDNWPADHYPGAGERAAFVKLNALPNVLPHDIDGFSAFFEARREHLIARIKSKLATRAGAEPNTVAAAATDIDTELGEADLDD